MVSFFSLDNSKLKIIKNQQFQCNSLELGVVGDQQFQCIMTTYDFSNDEIHRIEEPWTFYFSTEKNMLMFEEDPWKYAPRFGGFCTWGMGNEYPPFWPWQKNYLGPPAQPWDTWEVYNDTLLFNYFPEIEERFFEDHENNYQLAIDRWVGFWGELKAGPFNTKCDTADCYGNPQIGPKTPLTFTKVKEVAEPQVVCTVGSQL
eukprot:TRINITY_DN3060_c0_g2_i1.p1 TRINITY_DN3060_c0_g2~~TRINITY_DN3060_c0_g2_i1.p1  ORF type:complete len:232 (+),score=22.47 TRINITY_DN3060_c0_g2_i1:92-697(+)